jgi:hypothetical protein
MEALRTTTSIGDRDIPLEHVSETTGRSVPGRPAMGRKRSSSLPQSSTEVSLLLRPMSSLIYLDNSAMKQTVREPYVWIFAVFLCLYTGRFVSIIRSNGVSS